MISDQDINKLKKVFATKEELKNEIGDLRIEIGEINDKIDLLGEGIGTIFNKLDAISGAIQSIQEDNAAGAVMLARHTRQIKALALHTGMELPD